MGKIKVTLIKSPIGFQLDQKRTVEALGLKKINSFRIHEENDAVKGMIFKVKHLLKVEEAEETVNPSIAKKPKATAAKAEPKAETKEKPKTEKKEKKTAAKPAEAKTEKKETKNKTTGESKSKTAGSAVKENGGKE